MTGFVAAVSENSRLDAGQFPAYNRYFEGDLRVVAISFSCRGLEFRVFGPLWASINQHKAKDIRDRAEKIKSLQKQLAEARADNASLVAQNEKLREEFDDQKATSSRLRGTLQMRIDHLRSIIPAQTLQLFDLQPAGPRPIHPHYMLNLHSNPHEP